MTGLLITLQKAITPATGVTENIHNTSSSDSDYTVLGYYDDILIKPINKLTDFAPQIECVHSNAANSFSIRLISPKESDFQDYLTEKYPDIPVSWLFPKNFISENSMPLLSILLFLLSEEQMRDIDLVNNIKKAIDCISCMWGDYKKHTTFSICYCLGSADFAVLCHSHSYNPVFDILYGLREVKGFLSSSFMVSCMKRNLNANDISSDDETLLSIRAHFNDSGSVDNFINTLRDEMHKRNRNLAEMKPYRMSGNSDILFFPEKKLKEFVALYEKDDLLDELTKKTWCAIQNYCLYENTHTGR
jgi:hypothetical protein